MNPWRNSTNDYWELDRVSMQDIVNLEHQLTIQLPASYKELILDKNGGTLAFNAYPSPINTVWGNFVKVEAIRGIGVKNGILESDYLIKEWGLPNGLLLLDGEGQTWIALDYRSTKENPPIIFIDTERDQIIELAADFDVFLKDLYSSGNVRVEGDIEVEYGYMPSYTEEELLKELAGADVGRCIDLINAMPYSFLQDFVLEQYYHLLQRNELPVREAVASEFLNMVVNDRIQSVKLYDKLLGKIEEDSSESVSVYAGFIKDEMKK